MVWSVIASIIPIVIPLLLVLVAPPRNLVSFKELLGAKLRCCVQLGMYHTSA